MSNESTRYRATCGNGAGALLCISLAACGGGGGDAGPSVQPATPAPCASRLVTIQLFGDSTQAGQRDNLQRYIDARFGVGKVAVTNLGDSGTAAYQFPATHKDAGALTVANYGINDQRLGLQVDDYKAALRKADVSVYQTPSPPFDGYAQAMREVAAEKGRPVVDVSAYVRSLQGWDAMVPDGVHPNELLYQQITQHKVGPELAAMVAPLVCK